jgi:prolyl 4-hydroxylase
MIHFAKRLLVGKDAPFAPTFAMEMLAEALADGDSEAALITANLAAAGAWRTQSWEESFELLTIAAEQGEALAQDQLRLLGRAVPGERDWRAMAARISLADWLQPPQRTAICEAPRIRIAKRFLSPAVCDWLIGRARGRLQPAKMIDAVGAAPRFSAERTNSDYIIDIANADVVMMLVRARIAAFIEIPTIGFEPPQILHYARGQELKPHFDFLQRSVSQALGEEMGERIATVLIYLNDDFEGGETDFPRAGVSHKGAKGDVITFANVDVAGAPDPMTLHAGLPPVSGEKWLLSQWIRNRPVAAPL